MKQNETMSESELRQAIRAAEFNVTFIDLKRDFAFKWAFGTPGHEDLLLSLLRGLLPEKHIKSAQLGPQEQKPDREDAQGGIFDIYCETDDGSSLTIEMQVCPHDDFNDRMVFYSSFPIRNRVGLGVNNQDSLSGFFRYKLPPIYTIGILDFELQGVNQSERVIRHFSIREDDDCNSQFTDSIHYITVELPKFKKETSELSSFQDFVLYAIKNMGVLKSMPKEFSGKGLDKIFETCKFAHMNEDMQMKYVRQMMAQWDRESQLATAVMHGKAEGRAEGRAEGISQTAKAMKEKGVDTNLISEVTGLTPEQIAAL